MNINNHTTTNLHLCPIKSFNGWNRKQVVEFYCQRITFVVFIAVGCLKKIYVRGMKKQEENVKKLTKSVSGFIQREKIRTTNKSFIRIP